MFYVVLKLPLRLTSDGALTDPKALGQGESGHLQSLIMPCHAWDMQQVSNTISMAAMAPGTYNTVIVPVQTQTQRMSVVWTTVGQETGDRLQTQELAKLQGTGPKGMVDKSSQGKQNTKVLFLVLPAFLSSEQRPRHPGVGRLQVSVYLEINQ